MKRLCIVHTTPATVASLKPLANEILKGIEIYNIMDDSILPEINEAGEITERVSRRVGNMLDSARLAGADAVLIACSTIGEFADNAGDYGIPVYRIDRPMCEAAVERAAVIGVAATLRSTLVPTCGLINRLAAEKQKEIGVIPLLIEGANNLLNEGKTEEYDKLVSSAVMDLKSRTDIVVLAQASMARALIEMPGDREHYLTSPVSGLESLKCII